MGACAGRMGVLKSDVPGTWRKKGCGRDGRAAAPDVREIRRSRGGVTLRRLFFGCPSARLSTERHEPL